MRNENIILLFPPLMHLLEPHTWQGEYAFPAILNQIGLPHSYHPRDFFQLVAKIDEEEGDCRWDTWSERLKVRKQRFHFHESARRVVSGVGGGRIGRQSPIGIAVKIQGKAGYAPFPRPTLDKLHRNGCYQPFLIRPRTFTRTELKRSFDRNRFQNTLFLFFLSPTIPTILRTA